MSAHLRRLRLFEMHWDRSLEIGPVVITTEKRIDHREENAFRLGVDAGAFGLVAPSKPPPMKRRLRSV